MDENRNKASKRMLIICICIAVVGTICAVCVALGLSKGGGSVRAKDLMEGVVSKKGSVNVNINEHSAEISDFGIRLINTCDDDENTLVSPFSVLFALSMTANGAKGETLSEMEDTLGLQTGALNDFSRVYMQILSERAKYYGGVKAANAIWFKNSSELSVNKDFLQINADNYGASLYAAPFNRQTLSEINKWVKDNTDSMIPKILDELNPDAVMYLINALAFEAEWENEYQKAAVITDKFTKADGSDIKVPYLHSGEHSYICDDKATGFIKDYKYGKYSFLALLPNKGISPEEYMQTLTGEHLSEMIKNCSEETVLTKLPKFKTDYSIEMSGALKAMGMPLAFDENEADFSGMGTSDNGNIFISRVIHKTYIVVDEKGTKAAAATVVEQAAQSAGPIEEEQKPKEVFLTRPFIYMLMDNEAEIPLFIGIMRDPK